MPKGKRELVRDGGNRKGVCDVQVKDLQDIGLQARRLREVVRRYGMRRDCSVIVSQIAHELELIVGAYLSPRIPGIEG